MGLGLTIMGLPEGSVTVSAAELRRNFGVWQERAFSTPVVVVRHGKPRLVLSSAIQFFSQPIEPRAHKEEAVLSACAGIPDHSSEALLVMNRDLRVVAVNRIFEDLAGRHASNLVGGPAHDLFAAPCQTSILGHFRHVLQTGTPAQFEMPSALVEGRYYAFSAFPHAEGIAVLIVNRTAEMALREELEAHRSLAAGFALAVDIAHARLNLRGRVEEASPQFSRLMGLDPATDYPCALSDLVRGEAQVRTLAALDGVFAGGAPAKLDTVFVARHGESWPTTATLAPIWRGPQVAGATLVLKA